ncbi:L,D-transpeptidase catalytic domain [Ohtaekwangia koreensis]|uniref:L,D-transpeptidase catalytic domain n=2 Tax=Ohtaekwangia koreensis TaxID=688867 RepID=A0A1T5LQV7_9BACT|nr:L,D-transpeptidase catalytic domain [Ohtaekwangia koreensis]
MIIQTFRRMNLLFIMATILVQTGSFKQQQQKFERVKNAYDEKEETVKQYFNRQHLNITGAHIFIRTFKKERKLEVWIREKTKSEYTLLNTYDFCASSGILGPKRKEGDLQIPEGVYQINHFNPLSNFHLSLGINYPNASDKILSDAKRPGGSIYIHGNCVTVGCIPVTDDKIKELYILAVEAKNNGQIGIPVHIFPARLDAAGYTQLTHEFSSAPALLTFWSNLQKVYLDFEKTRKINTVHVNARGEYYL